MFEKRWSQQWLGEVPYAEALSYQKQTAESVRSRSRGVILGLEHPKVITLGLRLKNQNASEHSDIPTIHTNRGGQATLHNPGQLVIYPILPIRSWGLGVREYVDLLLKTSENFLRSCNITIVSSKNGLYSKAGKIASIGINVKNGIATHGVAINMNNELSDFAAIAACGVQDQAMDRVANYKDIELPAGFQMWCSEFERLIRADGAPSLTAPAMTP